MRLLIFEGFELVGRSKIQSAAVDDASGHVQTLGVINLAFGVVGGLVLPDLEIAAVEIACAHQKTAVAGADRYSAVYGRIVVPGHPEVDAAAVHFENAMGNFILLVKLARYGKLCGVGSVWY